MLITLDRFHGKIAVVTGAGTGIGAAITEKLLEEGLIVVGLARGVERIQQLAVQLGTNGKRLHAIRCDVTNEDDVIEAFDWTTRNVGVVHVLVNNAGIFEDTTLIDGDMAKWRATFDTNVLGLSMVTREAIQIMKAHHVDGHIINVNSVAGHRVPDIPGVNVYPASKFAVTALTETLRYELLQCNSTIKVTSLSPGTVFTDVIKKRATDFSEESLKGYVLQPIDVANAIVYVLSTPPEVQIKELTISPINEK